MKHSLPLSLSLILSLVACTPQVIQPDEDAQSMGKRVPMEWYAYNEGEDANGIPQNTLILKTIGETREELFTTQCAGTTLVNGIPDMDGSVASIQCWWAGGGDQFGVFVEDGEQAMIRHRTVDEEAGYGPWEDMDSF
jgi:hypothetical protein